MPGKGVNTFQELTPMQEINYRKEFFATAINTSVCI